MILFQGLANHPRTWARTACPYEAPLSLFSRPVLPGRVMSCKLQERSISCPVLWSVTWLGSLLDGAHVCWKSTLGWLIGHFHVLLSIGQGVGRRGTGGGEIPRKRVDEEGRTEGMEGGGLAHEQRHFYANKAKTEMCRFLSEAPQKRDTRLQNEIGHCQHFLRSSLLKYLKIEIHA